MDHYVYHEHPDDDQDFVAEYDMNGDPIKKFLPRRQPFKEWGEVHFQKRYRVPKPVAKDISRHFEEWTPYEWQAVAAAVPLEDRVSNKSNFKQYTILSVL